MASRSQILSLVSWGIWRSRALAKYYKCKEDIDMTAKVLDLPSDLVREYLANVKKSTGLDVHDTEDSFKLHLLMIAKKVLDTNKKIDKMKASNQYTCILLDVDDTLLIFRQMKKKLLRMY